MHGTFNYVNPATIHYGAGSAFCLDEVLAAASIHRVHIVTTQSLTKTKSYRRLLEESSRLGEATTSIVSSHVPIETVLSSARDIRRSSAQAVVAIGGGSAADAAKLAAHGASFTRLDQGISLDDFGTLLKNEPELDSLPVYIVPTTLSAAELYGDAGYTDSSTGHKTGVHNSSMTPRAVFYDPEVAAETPRQLWVSTGVRAIDHAVEATLSYETNPISRTLAASAVKDLLTVLPRTVAGTDDADDRLAGFMGAWKSFTAPPEAAGGISHALSRMIGAKNGIAHGVTSGVVLPQVIRYLHAHDEQARIRLNELASVAGCGDSGLALAEAVEELVRGVGLPAFFSANQICAGIAAEAARKAAQETGTSMQVASAIMAQCIR
ncbi:iron-containing alcohol dehydrogenase [Paenarthrobacter sp. NPDC057981]|uniref:iron-containing alcohol dehydrogenase n=1 Tax=Paenarthrobacter sp. NPDC057981 TaxID=3346297 RepID=UPI0036DBA750